MRRFLSRSPLLSPLATATLVALLSTLPAGAAQQGSDAGYRMPAPELAALVDAPTTPLVSASPDRSTIVLLEVPALDTIADLSQPELRLAGLRINPRTNGPSRGRYYTGMTIRSLANDSERPVTGLPEAPHLDNVTWAPDGSAIAFIGGADQWGGANTAGDVRLPDSV